jgi:hypothetical protein
VVKRADLLEQNNTVYLVMERLQGNSLRAFLTEPKSAQWILGWLKPLLATFEQQFSQVYNSALITVHSFHK